MGSAVGSPVGCTVGCPDGTWITGPNTAHSHHYTRNGTSHLLVDSIRVCYHIHTVHNTRYRHLHIQAYTDTYTDPHSPTLGVVGCPVGTDVGSPVGRPVGADDGSPVGAEVGSPLGSSVGSPVG